MLIPYILENVDKCGVNNNKFVNDKVLFSNNVITFDNCNDTSKFTCISNEEKETWKNV